MKPLRHNCQTTHTLESRIAPAIFTVNSLSDSGTGSGNFGDLRYCIGQANASAGADTIDFSVTGTITLTGNAMPTLSDSSGPTTIVGPGAKSLTVDADLKSRVLEVNYGVTAEIRGLTLTKGMSIGGSGLFNRGTLTLVDSIVSGSSANFAGGGIYNSGTMTVSRTTVEGNYSYWVGGGIYNRGGFGSLVVIDSTFSDNSAWDKGGAIYNRGTLTLTNSTISGNSAESGGAGIANVFASLSLTNATITENEGDGINGSGIYTNGGTVNCVNSIVINNKGGPIGETVDINNGNGGILNLNYSAVGKIAGSYTGANNLIGVNLSLGSLGNYGGPTQTIPLLAGSNAINKGTTVGAPAFDQRGLPRTGKVDMGAFEVQAPPTALVQIDDGTSQRSMVRSLTITFSAAVTFPDGLAAAIQLKRLSPGSPTGPVILNMQQTDTVVSVSFNDPVYAPGTNGSLIDGNYSLQLIASKINGIDRPFDGDGNGTGGDNLVVGFHRLFGDADGNGTVTAADFNAFRLAYGSTEPSLFDFDGDGQVSASDFNQFRTRYGVMLP